MVRGIGVGELVERFPALYHMAALGSWPSIEKYGLLSTSALLDLFGVVGEARATLESQHRPEAVTIKSPEHGSAVVRDQKPMDDAGLRRALQGGLAPTDWYRLLNGMVFFWLTEARLRRMLNAGAYRSTSHTVLEIDAAGLVASYEDKVLLCPINSGCTKPMPHPRGPGTFLPLREYPFADWDARRRSQDPVVELAIPYAVPDVRRFVRQVYDMKGG